jgi:hypothetical protein
LETVWLYLYRTAALGWIRVCGANNSAPLGFGTQIDAAKCKHLHAVRRLFFDALEPGTV